MLLCWQEHLKTEVLLLSQGKWNRTTGLSVPNRALYQAELHPDAG